MAYTNTISILIQAKDEASRVLKVTADSVESTASSLNKTGAAMSSLGFAMTKGLALPMAGVAIAGAKMAYDFQNKMELLHTNAGIAQKDIAVLSNQVLNMAGETGQGPEKLAEGLYHVASAGNGIWNTAQMMGILKTAAEGANLGLANLDETTYSLTSAMASGIKGVKDASEMMATLNAIVGAGDMKMNDLNGALSTGILSTAATFGISIQSVGAALATLTDNGEHADEAATRLRMTIALMSSPSSIAAKQLSALGLTAEDAKNATATMNKVFEKSGLTTTKLADDLRKPNGIAEAVKDLKTHLENAGLSASEADAMLSKAFGGGRTDAALLTMLQNVDRMDSKFQAINSDAGKFQTKLADLNKTDPQKLRESWATIQADLIRIGSNVLPTIATGFKGLADALSATTDWFKKLTPLEKTVFGDLGIALAVGGPILWGLGKVTSTIGSVIDITKKVPGVFDKFASVAKGAFNTSIAGASAMGGGIKSVITKMGDLTGSALSTASSWVASAASASGAWIKQGAVMAGEAAKSAGAWIKAAHNSEDGLIGSLIKMTFRSTEAAGRFIIDAAKTSAAWVASAIKTSVVWLFSTFPRIIAGFAMTSASAAKNAVISSAAWVKSAAVATAAWVAQSARVIAAFVATTASATVNAIAQAAMWVAAAVQAGAYGVAIEAVRAKTALFQALASSPITMGAIGIAGALADIALVMEAVNAVRQAISDLNKTNSALTSAANQADAIKDIEAKYKAGKITKSQETKAINALLSSVDSADKTANHGHALGTSFAPGGRTLLGENGAEIVDLPKGSRVYPASQTKQMLRGQGKMVHIENLNVNNNVDINRVIREIGWQLATR